MKGEMKCRSVFLCCWLRIQMNWMSRNGCGDLNIYRVRSCLEHLGLMWVVSIALLLISLMEEVGGLSLTNLGVPVDHRFLKRS